MFGAGKQLLPSQCLDYAEIAHGVSYSKPFTACGSIEIYNIWRKDNS